MKPVFQTRYGADGNCLAACIASILEIDLAQCDFTATADDWLKKCQAILKPLGFYYLGIVKPVGGIPLNIMTIPNEAFCIFVGESPRQIKGGKEILHCIVGQIQHNGEFQDSEHPLVSFVHIHDPIPDGTGIVGLPKELGFLIPLKP